MSIQRYQWLGINLGDVQSSVPVNVDIDALGTIPRIDMNLSNDAFKDDLDAAMADQGWQFVESSPATSLDDYRTIKQTAFTELVADTSTGSVVFVDLLSLSLTTDASKLEIQMTAAIDTALAGAYFRIVVDGTPVRATSTLTLGTTTSVGLLVQVTVGAGAHTVKLQWRTGALGTIQCQPVTLPNEEHCSLEVTELAA